MRWSRRAETVMRTAAVNRVWRASFAPAHRAFLAALGRPAEVQASRLREVLARGAGSAYGRRFGFARIATVRAYQDAVPIVGWDDLRPWVEAIATGRRSVLTTDPVSTFETTGGSTGGAKRVPYTAGLLAEFRSALGAWVGDLWRERRALMRGRAYWSITPPARSRATTAGGIPIGLGDDTEYFGPLARWALRRLLVTPPELAAVDDMAASRYVTLRFLLDADDLTFVSVWNPSFLTLLVGAVDGWAGPLLEDIARGTVTPPSPLPRALAARMRRRLAPRPERARELSRLLGRPGRLRTEEVWPRLGVVSCWTSASAARFVPELQAAFPGVEIQGKGLLATEGVVSIPLVGHPGGAIAVTSHFYEFVDRDVPGGRPRLVHEIEPGRVYSVVLTTSGGLYRYALGDLVTVVGRVGLTPLVEFVGRSGLVSDLCGEKLDDTHVARTLESAAARLGVRCAFLMLAPEVAAPPYYALFAEAPDLADVVLARLAAEIDAALGENPSYGDCRRLGQLGAVRAFRVPGEGSAAYLRRCTGLGQRAGAVKPATLHPLPGWQAHLAGVPV